MRIRPYQPSDFEGIRNICLVTCHDPFLLEHTEVLWTKYADYYTLKEPGNIFVAVDDDDTVKGYVLCSTDPELYRSTWKNVYRPVLKGKGFLNNALQRFTEWEIGRMKKRGYSAHLHIDLHPDIQRMGIGTQLMDALIAHLREKSTDGVYLGCSTGNPGGNAFYQKYGFTLLKKIPACNLYGYKLKGRF